MAKFYRGTTETAAEFPELVPGMTKFCRRIGGIDEILPPGCWHRGACCCTAEFDCRLDDFDAETMEFGRRNGEIVAKMAEY